MKRKTHTGLACGLMLLLFCLAAAVFPAAAEDVASVSMPDVVRGSPNARSSLFLPGRERLRCICTTR